MQGYNPEMGRSSGGGGGVRFKTAMAGGATHAYNNGNGRGVPRSGANHAATAKPETPSDEAAKNGTVQTAPVKDTAAAEMTPTDGSVVQQTASTTEAHELHRQQERERLQLQRKKESQRQNALEAMRMAEERRMRKCRLQIEIFHMLTHLDIH